MKLLFFDIDGVLNDHTQHENKYCGIGAVQASLLNKLLREIPDLQLVISSAWRYLIIDGSMTLEGFQNLLLTHGVCAYGRLHGHTACDLADLPEPACRSELIRRYVDQHRPEAWAAVDDLLLDCDNFVQTDGKVGLTPHNIADLDTILMRDGVPS